MTEQSTNTLTSDEYQRLALRTCKTPTPDADGLITLRLTPQQYDLLHSLMGLASEVGELASTVKAHMIYGKPLDVENVAEEYGDIDWYINPGVRAINKTRSQVQHQNIDKLRKRYPDGYSDIAAAERADKVVLEKPEPESGAVREYRCECCGEWNDVRGTAFVQAFGKVRMLCLRKCRDMIERGHFQASILRYQPDTRQRTVNPTQVE